jgi:hypothetical protein
MNAPETYRSRLRQYKRREHVTIWVGAGFAAFIALLATKIFETTGAPAWIIALLITTILLGGFLVACARVKFEWAATQIERRIEDNEVAPTDALPDERWPDDAERCWMGSLSCALLAGALALICVWWPSSKATPLEAGGAENCPRCEMFDGPADALWPVFGFATTAIAAGVILLLLGRPLWVKLTGAAAMLVGLIGPGYLIRNVNFEDLLNVHLLGNFNADMEHAFNARLEIKLSERLQKLGASGPEYLGGVADFVLGHADLLEKHDPQIDAICAKWAHHASGRQGLVLVVGATDHLPPTRNTRARFESNFGLARARAEAVKTRLASCSTHIPAEHTLALVTGPSKTPASGGSSRVPHGYGEDRRVDVWAFWNWKIEAAK